MTNQQNGPVATVAPPPMAAGPRRHLHGMWAAVAGSWAEHADFADARHAHATDRMLDSVRLRPGHRVLELACGPAGVGLAAASRVAPGGEVVLSDVVAEMTAIAAARAADQVVTNVRTREIDLEHIAEPDESFDAVLCRDGLQFALDPAQSLREVRRVLRPGGRVAITAWGDEARNPWLSVVFDALRAQLGRPVPPPGVPGPFSLADPDALAGLLTAAGLADVEISEISLPLQAPSFEAWWTRTTAMAGPLAVIMASLPDQARQELSARLRTAVQPYETAAGLTLPGLGLLATGRRSPAPRS